MDRSWQFVARNAARNRTGPTAEEKIFQILRKPGSRNWTRTNDRAINSRLLPAQDKTEAVAAELDAPRVIIADEIARAYGQIVVELAP